MIQEIKGDELIFHISYGNSNNEVNFYEENKFYEELLSLINIKGKGLNLFLIDDYNGLSLNEIMIKIQDSLKHKKKPEDICYVSCNKLEYKSIFLPPGCGRILYEETENLKLTYKNIIFDFYNSDVCEEKEKLIKEINHIRNEKIEELLKASEELNFQVKTNDNGFTFIPTKETQPLSEYEFNHLNSEEKSKMFQDVDYLKKLSKNIIDYISEKENDYVNVIKLIFNKFLYGESEILEKSSKINEGAGKDYINLINKEIIDEAVESFTLRNEEVYNNIEEFIDNFKVKIIKDNENIDYPHVIYLDKPTVNNLFGKLEFESKKEVYVTDISMFTEGSLIKANEGCIIMNVNDLLAFKNSYYYLKKTFLNSFIDYDYSSEYMEILPVKTIKLGDIPIDEKLILIGNYQTYSALKCYDDEFLKIFPIQLEINPIIEINPYNNDVLKNKIYRIGEELSLLPVKEEGITEIFRYFSKISEDKGKIYYNYDDMKNILMKASSFAEVKGKSYIGKEDIFKAWAKQDSIEDLTYDTFKNNSILFNINGTSIGEVNGLSVIETSIKKIGKPVKITCTASYGDGKIHDIHKDSSLTGKLYSKSVGILKGFLNSLMEVNENLPLDFYINFEQVYSVVDGDSASVAEMISIISALCSKGVKQNLAVTGSINQFGQVQPIGGVNEKIEGFYKVCSIVDTTYDKGVIIPKLNLNNLILDDEILEDVENGSFHIYTMETVEDAAKILLDINSIEEAKDIIKECIKKSR